MSGNAEQTQAMIATIISKLGNGDKLSLVTYALLLLGVTVLEHAGAEGGEGGETAAAVLRVTGSPAPGDLSLP